MRRIVLCGLVAVAGLYAAPLAKASDDSVRQVVVTQAQRQVKEDKRFGNAMKHLRTRAGLKKASKAAGRQAASVKMWADALRNEHADTPAVAKGRLQMLNALNLYTRGIRKLQKAIRQSLHAGGSSGYGRARAAFRNMSTASKKVEKAARMMAG
jgi:hypothetical protein